MARCLFGLRSIAGILSFSRKNSKTEINCEVRMKARKILKTMLPVDAIFALLGLIDWIKTGGVVGAAVFVASLLVTLVLVWKQMESEKAC